MSVEVRTAGSLDELRQGLNALGHYAGFVNGDEDVERVVQWLPLERMHVARDGDAIVGGAGAFDFRVSVPGNPSVQAAGVTAVGVLPSHRRQGVLRSLMSAQLEACRARGDRFAYLWASEATIYGRFGYGLAARGGGIELARDRAAFARPFTPRGRVRLVAPDEAAELFPPLYAAAMAQRPGMFSRTDAWWRTRRLAERPSPRSPASPVNCALLELDGAPVGYAIYRVEQAWDRGSSIGKVRIIEVVTPTPEATRELWRWLLDFDWTGTFVADFLPLDHPLFLLLAEPRRARFTVGDTLWVRLVDVEGALATRTYRGEGSVVLEVADELLPQNAGRYRVSAGGVERTDEPAGIALAVAEVGSVYLGGFTFADLVRASRATELVPGAIERADACFATGAEPWCPEIF